MNQRPNIKLYAFTLDCLNPLTLAKFYAHLLQWEVVFFDEDFASIAPPNSKQGGYPCILFQKNLDYTPPVWPREQNQQQQMAHMDFAVANVEKAVDHAISLGASLSKKQFSDGWKVMLDPEGHPFCLCFMKPIMDSPDFALL